MIESPVELGGHYEPCRCTSRRNGGGRRSRLPSCTGLVEADVSVVETKCVIDRRCRPSVRQADDKRTKSGIDGLTENRWSSDIIRDPRHFAGDSMPRLSSLLCLLGSRPFQRSQWLLQIMHACYSANKDCITIRVL